MSRSILIQRSAGAEAAGLALVAAAALDGVPENLALGVGLAESGFVRAPRLDPGLELSGGIRRRGSHAARRSLLGASSLRVGLTPVAVALFAGRLAADVASEQSLGMLAALAAGAVLAALADSVMPEAYSEGGPLVAFATSGGFLPRLRPHDPRLKATKLFAGDRPARRGQWTTRGAAATWQSSRGSSMRCPTTKETT